MTDTLREPKQSEPRPGERCRVEGRLPVRVVEAAGDGLFWCRDLANGELVRLPAVLLESEE